MSEKTKGVPTVVVSENDENIRLSGFSALRSNGRKTRHAADCKEQCNSEINVIHIDSIEVLVIKASNDRSVSRNSSELQPMVNKSHDFR